MKDLILPILIAAGLAVAGVAGVSPYVSTVAVTFAVYAIAILGLSLVTGYVGEVSVGHAGLLGTGAYASAYTAINFGLHPAAATVIAIVAGAAMGAALGLPTMRAKTPSATTLMSLAFGTLVSTAFSQSEWTGGEVGLTLPALSNIYWIAIGALVAAIATVHLAVTSKLGRAWRALESSPIAVDVLGVGVAKHKIIAFTLSGALCGLAGSVFAYSQNIVIPSQYDFGVSVLLLLGLLCGGKQSISGAILGAGVAVALPLALAGFGDKQSILFSILTFGVVSLMPNGIAGFFNLHQSKTPAPKGQSPAIHQVAATDQPVLEVRDVGMRFGQFDALRNVNLTVKAGECVGLIGPNGAGKSTLMNVITGLYQPTAGTVALHGKLSRTFQNLEIFDHGMTVLENVLVGLHHHPAADRVNRAYALLRLVGLEDKAALPVSSLSYAGQRFTEIARALGTNPALLLLDEPAAGMRGDDLTRLADVIETIKSSGIAVLLIDHHLDIVWGASDRCLVLDAGAPLATGTADEVRHNPDVLTAYLGEAVC